MFEKGFFLLFKPPPPPPKKEKRSILGFFDTSLVDLFTIVLERDILKVVNLYSLILCYNLLLQRGWYCKKNNMYPWIEIQCTILILTLFWTIYQRLLKEMFKNFHCSFAFRLRVIFFIWTSLIPLPYDISCIIFFFKFWPSRAEKIGYLIIFPLRNVALQS